MKVLVTGGAGYIGSHTVHCLSSRGFTPVSIDNLSQGHREAVGPERLVVGDLADRDLLHSLLAQEPFEAVLHFAALASVPESMEHPRLYYAQNLVNALGLLQAMLENGVKRFVLSSTCAVYGLPEEVPIPDSHPCRPLSPYGHSKRMLEEVLEQYARAYALQFVSLRYFNAAGASLDGRLGESHDPETHLVPRVLQVALGKQEKVSVFGSDYDTPDGTCIRDFVHVVDLAEAHVMALEHLDRGGENGCFNLGSGEGCSVRQVVETAARVCGRPLIQQDLPRREGDPPRLVAGAERARRVLGWEPRHSDLETIIATAWRWEQSRRY